MRISVFGLGYVGSVSAVCLAELGHQVKGIDIVPDKVNSLQGGTAPIKEPQLDDLLQKNLASGRLEFTSDMEAAILEADCAMVAVGTPSDEQGQVQLRAVERCITQIAQTIAGSDKSDYLLVIRSTVPPQTTERMAAMTRRILADAQSDCQIIFSMNPEFTREGAAVHDFLFPAIIVFGSDQDTAQTALAPIYAGIKAETIWVNTRTAELVKYTNNAFHALKVAFANEIGRIASAYDIDGQDVMNILCADKKLNISTKYLRPGFAFGGSCLPKDLRGISGIAQAGNVDIPVLRAVLPSNTVHIAHFKARILAAEPQRIGILGIAFKRDTDDLRESPGLRLASELIDTQIPVKMLDVNLQLNYLMGRNKAYIDEVLPPWQKHYTTDLEELFAFADTIVVTNDQPIYRQWVEQFAGDKKVFLLS